jgi:hypothetical protein
MSVRLSRRDGCLVEEGNRRFSERLKLAEKKIDEGNLGEAWKLVRLAIERLYTVAYKKYGPADFDIKLRFVASAVWQLPYGHGRAFGSSSSRFINLLFGGWDLSPILAIQGGRPLSAIQSQLLNLGNNRINRPNRIANGNLPADQHTVSRWFDTNAFVILQTDPTKAGFVPNQAFGNSGVGIMRGPHLYNFDFNLAKEVRITERQSLQFRAEFFNALNHTNLGIPGMTVGSGFGEITTTETSNRQIQFGLKIRF